MNSNRNQAFKNKKTKQMHELLPQKLQTSSCSGVKDGKHEQFLSAIKRLKTVLTNVSFVF